MGLREVFSSSRKPHHGDRKVVEVAGDTIDVVPQIVATQLPEVNGGGGGTPCSRYFKRTAGGLRCRVSMRHFRGTQDSSTCSLSAKYRCRSLPVSLVRSAAFRRPPGMSACRRVFSTHKTRFICRFSSSAALRRDSGRIWMFRTCTKSFGSSRPYREISLAESTVVTKFIG